MDPREQKQDNNEQEVHNLPGSNDHNDYRIKGNEKNEDLRDEEDSYVDYNGNSEENDPGRA